MDEKLIYKVPKWDIPKQNRIIKDLESQGFCLVDVKDAWDGRKLIFRRK